MTDPDIEDFDYITSSIGNAYFSGVSLEQLWSCISISESREDIDAAIDATIRLNNIKE